MDMGKTWRIGDDCISYKWLLRLQVGLYTSLPASTEHFRNHPPLTSDVTVTQTPYRRYEPGILDHIRH